ncbi:L,D-transpeptidase family protein [Lentisalinibacter salinarum]|uniref:L,D-transpeptidase family protein n=1 Tax=Lentisalinibacter salinarum TaxID=2992239 RepID=UPI0038637B82
MTMTGTCNRALVGLVLTALSLCASAAPTTPDHIRNYLEGLDAGDFPTAGGQTLLEPELLSRVYRSRDHATIWLDGGPLAGQAPQLLTAIGESVGHGFNAERYHRSTIEQLMQAGDASSRLALELLMTDAFLAQALHRGRGAVFPPNLDADWQLPQAEVDAAALLLEMAGTGGDVAARLAALWPVDPEYAALVRRRAEIAATGDEMTARVAPGPLLRPGQSSDRVIMLKQRLMGPGDYTPEYDADLAREVKAFQLAAGLEPDGLVGEGTLEVLNATRSSWIDRIDANLERWRWLPRATPQTYIRVNIASYRLRAIENGETTLAMNVIVGKPYRRTPVFTETMKYLVFNPYWNVPFSIATKDKLPLLKADAAAEAAKGFDAKPRGSEVFVPVDAIDWTDVTRRGFDYLLRQRPGPQNALGQIKFMLPNPYAVYLHDTPSRELFAKQERSFSSGCVRLERPTALAQWLLAHDGHRDAGRVDQLIASAETTTIYLRKPVPVYIVYFTAFLDDDGHFAFRRDIYERDRAIVEALRASGADDANGGGSPIQ